MALAFTAEFFIEKDLSLVERPIGLPAITLILNNKWLLDEEKIGLIEKETYGNLKKERRRERNRHKEKRLVQK